MSKGKDDMGKRLASLSFAEKIKILEKLRDRSLTLAASGLRRASSTQEIQVSNQVAAKATKEG